MKLVTLFGVGFILGCAIYGWVTSDAEYQRRATRIENRLRRRYGRD